LRAWKCLEKAYHCDRDGALLDELDLPVEYIIRITIEAYDKAGHNLDTVLLNAAYAVNLSFIPTMSAQRLLDGYRSILKRMYARTLTTNGSGGFWSAITPQAARAGRSRSISLSAVL
jgi:hypothetical protein